MTGWEALRSLQMIRGITHVVQHGTERGDGINTHAIMWETVAAFNDPRVADRYRVMCALDHPTSHYRIKELEGWIE